MISYAVWNNKGGVGKTFLAFALASEYAYTHEDKVVYIVDMCPQANVSEIVLGGNSEGSQVLENLIGGRNTIGGYVDERLRNPHSKTGGERGYVVKARTHNESMPENLNLVAGDPSLEVQAESINQIAGQTLPPESWQNVHSWLADLVQSIASTVLNSTFFIDCNPSFAAYTELAIMAADKLIVPCTVDGSSARAIKNIGQLVYGLDVPDAYKSAMFSKRASRVPSIHIVLLNRSTQYGDKASKAFKAMFGKIKSEVDHLIDQESRSRGFSEEDKFYDMPDAHYVAIVSSHEGLPIRELKTKQYRVHEEITQINSGPLDRYQKAIETVVESL